LCYPFGKLSLVDVGIGGAWLPMASANLHYFHPDWIETTDAVLNADIAVYGGTSAGVVAAVAAARRGIAVVLLHPGLFLGGMSSSGLGFTDAGMKEVIGGISREFYRRVGAYYGLEEEWCFEPHVAARVFRDMIDEAGVPVYRRQFLGGVSRDGRRIAEIGMLGGLRVRAQVFIDATYEGDLMAKAGVSYVIGREGNAVYDETLNGFQISRYHQFDCPVDPYIVEGDPSSGLAPFVNPQGGVIGEGDHRLQAYCFRVCMTQDPENRVPFPRPEGFDPLQYVLLPRWLRCTEDDVFAKFDRIQGNKTDTNNRGAVSTDFIGANYLWADADYETRERIFQAHVTYQQGLHWFMANDPSVPAEIREQYATWGLAKDEFVETDNWPPQLYVREARRMVADYVVTEHDCTGRRRCEDSVGMGSYQMDSHNCQRFVSEGRVLNEGDVQVALEAPYPISYRSIIPRRGECENLAVPVAASASHIAFGSLRMEPVFMILAESAAIAATLAIKANCALQALPYRRLEKALLDAGQVLSV